MKKLILIILLFVSSSVFGQWNIWNGGTHGGTTTHDTIIIGIHPETQRQLLYITGLTVLEQKTLDTLNRHNLDSLNVSSYLNAGYYCYYLKFPSKDTIFNIAQNNYHLSPAAGITLRTISWKPNGTSGYYNTNFNPAAAGVSLTSFTLGVWTDTSDNADNVRDIGCYDGTYGVMLWHRPATGDYQNMMLAGTLIATTANLSTQEMLMASRTGAWVVNIMRNDSLLSVANNQGTGIPNGNIYLCAVNSSGTASNYSAREQYNAFIAIGFTPTQMRMHYNNFKTYWKSKW